MLETSQHAELGNVALLVEVPPPPKELRNHEDIAEAYAVEIEPDASAGCIIWGKFFGVWHANVSARWLVLWLIHQRNERYWEGHRDGYEMASEHAGGPSALGLVLLLGVAGLIGFVAGWVW